MRNDPMVLVSCDRCEQETVEVNYGQEDEDLKAEGWIADGTEDVCPECQADEEDEARADARDGIA